MRNESSRYILEAELSKTTGRILEKSQYQFLIQFDHLEDVGQWASTYDPILKMHFEDLSALGAIYQFEIIDVSLCLSKKLAKATELIRRANYVNDWMEIRVNTMGVVKSVENREELKENWQALRQILSHDYTGKVPAKYLAEIDERVNLPDKILPAVYTYLNFGLIFPHIPPKHPNEWSKKRTILFSEYDEAVEETITYTGLQEERRRYDVQWATAPQQKMQLLSGKGYYFLTPDEIFPMEAEMEVTYRYHDAITCQWLFKLEEV